MSSLPSAPDAAVLQALTAVVVKQGVHLGGLSPDGRARVLALVWAGLPDGPLSEPQVNAVLKQQLAGSARFLATDHVELRRWLVDGAWLQRDGFGREYRRCPPAGLPSARADLASALQGIDIAAWVAAQQAGQAAARQARRTAWLGREGSEAARQTSTGAPGAAAGDAG
jgi:hypothetical protein